MNRKYYAHSGNEVDKSDWQLLSDHLKKVGRIAAENARYFDAEVLAAGRYCYSSQPICSSGLNIFPDLSTPKTT